ncbi:NepR family anti-sigma factor [uncultured Algimonas sp.]|uniref:NepR family anti-sigma factor n=1 Tax=uncultured Algimonas sp. TaxID=1547920 RepID=UPI00261828E5|nr:NepR family anti-sigma factor [uncultured Algimonas sp.]
MTDDSQSSRRSHKRADSGQAPFDKEALPDKIGSSLRNLYDKVLNEDVPDDFLSLLRQADKAPAPKTGRGAK